MDFNIEEVLDYTEKVLNFIAKEELSSAEIKWAADETLNCDQALIECKSDETGFTGLHGLKYIDCLGSNGSNNLGYHHPRIIGAVKNQLERQILHRHYLLDPLSAMLSKLVAMITPGDLQNSFFTNSGAEAVEGALKLARLNTGRPGVVAAVNGCHGNFSGSLSFTAGSMGNYSCLPILPFIQHVPYGDADMLRKTLASSHAVGIEIGAVILEPIQGEAGIVLPPEDYFSQVRDLCDQHGAMLIVDEVQTGMGRSGMLFAFEHYGITPDLVCLGKSFGGGIMPIGVVVSKAKAYDKIESRQFMHSKTTGENPLACAAAVATIQVVIDEGLVEQAAEKGSYILPQLQRMARKYSVLKEARGRGLLIGLEFKEDRHVNMVVKGLYEHGILTAGATRKANTIRIEPALTISIDEIDLVLEVLDKVIKAIPE